MPKKARAIELTEEQKAQLEEITRNQDVARKSVERAKIILACAEGKQNREIALDYQISLPRISKWRSRFAEEGIAGLEDARRSGKPAIYGEAFKNALLLKLEEEPPEGLVRWNSQALAEVLNASKYAVWRALKKEGVHLHRMRN
jgi:transposase